MKKIIMMAACFISLLSFGETKTLPVEFFASLPDVSRMQLSPDGNKLASVVKIDAGEKQGTAIQVIDLNTKEKKFVLFTDNKTFELNWIKWKGDSTLLTGIYFAENRTEKKTFRHYKVREQRLLIIDVESSTYHEAFSRSYQESLASFGFNEVPTIQDNIIDLLEDDPDHILMSIQSNGPRIVVKLDIKRQSVSIVQPQEPRVWNWVVDRQHKVRIAYWWDPFSSENKILLVEGGRSKWRELWHFNDWAEDEIDVLGFGVDPNVVFINAYFQGKLAIFKVNLTDPKLERELILSSPTRDIMGDLVYSPLTNDVIGIKEPSAIGISYFDNSFIKLFGGLNKALPNTKNYLMGLSKNERRYLVLATSDSDPGAYYLGDRDKGSLDLVARRFKNLNRELMTSKKQYLIKARDGLEIETFLSIPQGAEPKNLPTIVLLHDGQIWRDDEHTEDEYLGDRYVDDQNFNAWTQFLTNRGYAVLQINYRGSPGKGFAFTKAAFKQWGNAVQDDVEDGVRFFVAQGIVDKNSVGILGGGFGGYSALYSAVRTPNFYKFAISVSGFSDLDLYAYDRKAFWLSNPWVETVIGTDSSEMKKMSPITYANEFNIPVLLIHGDSDRRIEPKHSIAMFEKLKKLNKKVEYIELTNEDHFLTDNRNRIKTFKAIDEFLAKYLPVKN